MVPAATIEPLQSAQSEKCPRCNTRFECRAALSVPCDCFKIRLSAGTHDYIKSLGYTSCLCNNCLQEIDEQLRKS